MPLGHLNPRLAVGSVIKGPIIFSLPTATDPGDANLIRIYPKERLVW
jgi:hypothetical protein